MKKYSLLLPKTQFSERVQWQPHQEEMLNHWETNAVEKIIQEKSRKYGKKFILHLGPPYATGDLHKGHLLNCILKNFAIRGYQNLGYEVVARPGWDCHGLPIEMKVEALYKNPTDPLLTIIRTNEALDANPIVQFRKDCKNFANYWINIQKESLKLLGFAGSLDDYYTTMDGASQRSIIQGFLHMVSNRWVHRRKKVSMWSTVEKTTLSEAEIQYKDDHISHSVYFVTRITKCPLLPALENKFMTVWTTTPWTLPGNNGYAYHDDLTYQLIQWGIFIFIAEQSLVQEVCKKILTFTAIETENTPEVLLEFKGSQLAGSLAEHPIGKYDVPIVHGDFVGGVDAEGHRIGEKGTGFVHIAGAHGIDDFNLSLAHNMAIKDWLNEDGTYIEDLDQLAGFNGLQDPQPVIDLLGTKLLVREKYKHRYPYSERGKNPIIFKLSYQWFIDIDESNIRDQAHEATNHVRWIPSTGKNRIQAMLKTRKEWVLSRQRWWGIPITWFYHKKTGDILQCDPATTQAIIDKILKIVEQESYDFWYANDNEAISKALLPVHLVEDYIPCKDIMDVWFESGMTHDYVVRQGNKDIIADLYIEGSDQHRGWFQSSLLTSIALYQNAPYKTVLTHGFVLDAHRQKMSKSLGNVVSLRDCCNNIGCDIMAIWVAMADFTEEISFNENIITIAKETYTSIRNRCKFLLAVLNGNNNHWDPIDPTLLSSMDQYILAKITQVHGKINEAIGTYDFRQAFIALHEFCNHDLSKIYFIYIKDLVYCNEKNDGQRQNIIKIIHRILKFVMHHGKVFLPFLMEDVFMTYRKENMEPLSTPSVFGLEDFQPESQWTNHELLEDFNKYLTMANEIMIQVEQAIKEGVVKNKSESVVGYDGVQGANCKEILLELCKVADIIPGTGVTMTAKGKCDRCWNYVIDNGEILCDRCEKAELNGNI